ncbi:MAG: hypothetical protein J6T10_25020 [Methanobrevibacter sp.]|nr:hypothetical protein [Methanobrevibacter sp.]
MGNFQTALKATETAYNSTGSAARENQKVLESLNGSIQKLKSEWESLVNSKSTQDTLKFLVDLTTNIVKVVKALGGLKTILILLVARFVATKVAALGLAFATEVCGAEFAAGLTKGELFALGLKRVQLAANSASISIGALTAAIAVSLVAVIGFVAWIDNLSKAYERNDEAVRNAIDAYEESENKLKNIESELKNVRDKIQEINAHPLDPTTEKTLEDLKKQEAQLEANYKLQQKYNALSRENEIIEIKNKLSGEGKYSLRELEQRGMNLGQSLNETEAALLLNPSTSLIGIGYEVGAQNSRFGSYTYQIQESVNQYNKYTDSINNLSNAQEKLNKLWNEGSISLEEYESYQKKIDDRTAEIESHTLLLNQDLLEYATELSNYQNILEEGTEEYNTVSFLLSIVNDAISRHTEVTNKDTESIKENIETLNQYEEIQKDVNSKLEGVYSLVEEADKKYKDLSAAVEEYNEQGKLSISTLSKMMKDYPEYLDALNKEGWSIETVNNMLSANIKIKLEEAKIAAQAAKERIQNAKTHLEEAKAALLNAEANDTLANSHAKIAKATHDAQHEERNATQEYNEQMRKIAELEAALAGGFGGYSTKKTSGSSSSKKETDAWKQAFTDAYNELKHRRSLDLIDTKQYIEELTALNDKYFKDRVEYEDEYNKYVEELYKERQNLFKEQLNDLKFAFEMLENQGANKQTLILKYKEIQDALHQQAEYYRSLNLAENHDLIQDLQSQWWDYQKKIKELEQGIADEIEKQNKEIKEQMDKELDLLDERFKALKEYAVDMIDKEIELKEQALQKQNDLLDEQIEKYKEEEDNLENQKDIEDKLLKIEEARKKLAEAKNQKVRVYRAGKGFVYESDFNAVSQAQKQLDELLKEWNLFQEKAKIANIIAELEAEKEANEKRVNAEIADLNTLKDAWDKSLDISKDVENYKGWLTKIESSEKLSFNQRLAQVKTFVTAYNNEMALIKSNYPTTDEVSAVVSKDSNKAAITSGKNYGGVTYYPDVDYQALINNTLANAPESEKASLLKNYETKRNAKIAGEGSSQAQTSLYGGTTFSTTSSSSSRSSSSSSSGSSRSSSSSSGSRSSSSSSSSGSTTMSKNDQTKIAIAKEAYNTAKAKGDTAGMAAAHAVAESVRASYGYSGGGDGSQHIGLASGTNNADGNIHLVGEEGPELFIPPSGSGIIPNPKTNNLMQWGTINPASLLAAISQGQGTTIEVDNITLPNVRDAESFVEELKNFKNYAIQRQSIRK